MTETIEDRQVTYTLEISGKFHVIENVPARVCLETGEQFFAPETVEKLRQMIGTQTPKRVMETPVYEFAT